MKQIVAGCSEGLVGCRLRKHRHGRIFKAKQPAIAELLEVGFHRDRTDEASRFKLAARVADRPFLREGRTLHPIELCPNEFTANETFQRWTLCRCQIQSGPYQPEVEKGSHIVYCR